MYKVLMFLVASVLFLVSCKETKVTDPILMEALVIQDEAIHIGMEIDSIIADKMSRDTSDQNKILFDQWKESIQMWKDNMIPVPGVELAHDHSAEGHEGHDHGHDHSHGNETTVSHLTPSEIKQVQIEWKDAIVKIRGMVK
jgi:hypothetical protein